MTIPRVTVGSLAYSGLTAIKSTSATLATMQQRLSSGKQILKPSDDPTGTVQAMGLRSELARNEQYASSATDALAWLSTADTTYSQIVSTLQQARTAVVQGLNSGANDTSANEALAQQLDGIRSTLTTLANTAYNGRPVFGGTTASGAAYDANGAYVGDTGTVTRAVAPNTVVQVTATGPDVFGSGADDAFTMLTQMSAALRSDPSALTGSLQRLDSAISRVSSAQATEGATFVQVQNTQSSQTAAATATQTELSGIVDIDPAEMAIKVTTAYTAYQSALQTTASIRQLSLLDFLK